MNRNERRWNFVYDMFEWLHHLHWPIAAVLGDKNVVTPSNAKTLDMSENWQIMVDMLPVFQPLKIVTSLLSADQSVSIVYPTIWKLVNVNLALTAAEFQPLADFNKSVVLAIHKRLQIDSVEVYKHPFVISTVLDPSLKRLDLFPVEVKRNAYDHVRKLFAQLSVQPAITPQSTLHQICPTNRWQSTSRPTTCGWRPCSSWRQTNREWRRVRTTSMPTKVLPFLMMTMQMSWNGWLITRGYPKTAALIRPFLCIPATLTSLERLFTAMGWWHICLCWSLLPEAAENLVFHYKNNHLFDWTVWTSGI